MDAKIKGDRKNNWSVRASDAGENNTKMAEDNERSDIIISESRILILVNF